jgi:hypothetical protein
MSFMIELIEEVTSSTLDLVQFVIKKLSFCFH